MIFLSKHLKYILLLLFTLAFAACSENGTHIAVLNHSASEEKIEEIFPESGITHFKSSSEFLLALATGKCDVGIAGEEEGAHLLSINSDYAVLPYAESEIDGNIFIVHRRLLPGTGRTAQDGDFLEHSIDRVKRSIISNGYWKLIIRGFAATVSIFMLGILMALALAILMLIMNNHRRLRYISKPLSWFIKTIHDVPSIVLIFFFYYVVFAHTHMSGIFVCAISLGVYCSGSLMNIFTVHLKQIDSNQHAAAEMLGLTGWKKYRYVILPQAVKPMLPLIGAESKALLRATTYAGYISEVDLVKVTEIIRNQTYDVLVPLLMVSAIFLILSHLIIEGLSALYNKAFQYD